MKPPSYHSIFYLTALLSFAFSLLSPVIAEYLPGKPESAETDIQQAYQRAMNGDVDAQFFLFMSYRSGIGVEHSITNAVRWLLSAGENGHAEAQYWLGHIYFFGNGVERDVENGMRWYKKSATQGFIRAQVDLGAIYNGWRYRFYPSNHVQAMSWYSKAAEQGHLRSIFIVGCSHYFGIQQLIDISEGLSWFQKAAELGDDTATAYLKMDNNEDLRLFCDLIERL